MLAIVPRVTAGRIAERTSTNVQALIATTAVALMVWRVTLVIAIRAIREVLATRATRITKTTIATALARRLAKRTLVPGNSAMTAVVRCNA